MNRLSMESNEVSEVDLVTQNAQNSASIAELPSYMNMSELIEHLQNTALKERAINDGLRSQMNEMMHQHKHWMEEQQHQNKQYLQGVTEQLQILFEARIEAMRQRSTSDPEVVNGGRHLSNKKNEKS